MDRAVKTDRRILRTKEAILRSFLELFSEKEFDQITVNEIAERSNVNRGTFYLHYTDKYDLLDKCVEARLNELISLCGAREADQADPGMSDPQPIFDYFREHFAFFFAMLSNQREVVFRDRMMQFIAASLLRKMEEARGKQADDELNAQFMASAFVGIVEWWIRRRMPYSAEFMAARVRGLFEKNEVYLER